MNEPAGFQARGLEKLSSIDYPPYQAAVVFAGGCNFRCPYCHNRDLVLSPDRLPAISEAEILGFLEARKKWLDAVVVSGGEPTIVPGLKGFVRKAKALGYRVKLDTNGTRPAVIKQLLDEGLLDFISMDIKAPIYKYPDVVMAAVSFDKIRESIQLVYRSGVDYEFRTTLLPRILSRDDILAIARMLEGSKRFVLQQFRPRNTIEPGFAKEPRYSAQDLREMADEIRPSFGTVVVRE